MLFTQEPLLLQIKKIILAEITYTVEFPAIVILAAGVSSRFGSSKQVLPYKGKTLLQHAADTALETGIRPVVIVLGAGGENVKKEIDLAKAELVYNDGWQEGIASSVRCGLDAAQQLNPATDAIIFMVCDQPFVSKTILNSLITKQSETGLPIIACCYNTDLGTPALFHKIFFGELNELRGDTGARKLIKQHENLVASIEFPNGIIDIDSKSDYEALLRSS